MPSITIILNDGMFAELQLAARRTCEPGFDATDFATEAIESVLASRRLPTVTLGRHGARIGTPSEIATHRVLLPERVCQS
jgi:hypothetical protein